MATHTWWESSLSRSSQLGRQVLERAQRRRVDWHRLSPSPGATQTEVSQKKDTRDGQKLLGKKVKEEHTRTGLDDAFDSIAEFMAHTSHQCQKFYNTVPAVHQSSEHEVNHALRYHSHQRSRRMNQEMDETPEDFHIEVSPGTYAITAGAEETDRETQLVRVNAGESVSLTFHL